MPRSPSLLQHLLTGAVRWKGAQHRAKPHSRPPWRRKRPKVRKGATQRGEKYKLKSHQGARKRFYQLADGTFMHKAAGKNHLMAGASHRRQTRRLLKYRPVITPGIVKKLRRLMPYGAPSYQDKGLYKYEQPLMWDRPEGWSEMFRAAKQRDGVDAVKKLMKAAAKKQADASG